jgi:3',5'-nucleoside bisphosphate phosphatase
VLALTDHDTLDGLAEARAAARQHAIELIDGVEISVTWYGRTLHVVGLNVDPGAPSLAEGLGRVRAGRLQRAESIGRRLAGLGIADSLEGALELATNRVMVGRAHFARHLVSTGVVKDMKTAFRRYLGEDKPAYVRHQWACLADAIGWIRRSGGIAVLAHPGRYGLRRGRLRELFCEFRTLGGEAVEVVTASHAPDQVTLVAGLAVECGLRASAGSDFHCPEESWLDLGQLPGLPAGCDPIWRDWPLCRTSVPG